MNHVDSTKKSPTLLSFCPGVLGLERGLQRVIGTLDVVAYCEIEAFICANLIAGMESGVLDPAPIWQDAKTFPKIAAHFHRKIDIMLGGYPCQPFSRAGKQDGEQDPRHLWPYLRSTIAAVRPVCCFFENVEAHLTMGFDTVYKELVDLGYKVEAGLFTAEEVGAPHKRERLFILAILANPEMFGELSGRYKLGKNAGSRQQLVGSEPWSNIINRSKNELGNAGLLRSEVRQEQATGIEQSDKELGNAESSSGGLSICSGRQDEACAESFWASEELEHADLINGQRRREKFKGSGKVGLSSEEAKFSRWPAGVGNYQHEWEEPRTIESSVGITINGYNFRADLLRAYGNSVVEQTAALAWITLLNQHFQYGYNLLSKSNYHLKIKNNVTKKQNTMDGCHLEHRQRLYKSG